MTSYETIADNSSRIVFASDFHLGVPDYATSLVREKKLVEWLEQETQNNSSIYLMGDLFDFWFEYKHVVPKYHVRLLGTLARLRDNGISIKVFTGNHDMWLFDYFEKELNIKVYRKPLFLKAQNKLLMIGHGDGLGPKDYGYKRLKKIFSNPFLQWCFARLHPNFAFGVAQFFSNKSRLSQTAQEEFKTLEDEWLWQYCKRKLLEHPDIEYFIFGHRHLKLDLKVGKNARYINTGTWFDDANYALFENGQLELKIHV